MKKKIIGILIIMTISCGSISSASVLENKEASTNINGKNLSPCDRGETNFYPPWESIGGAGNEDSGEGGFTKYVLEYDEYDGYIYARAGSTFVGWAQTDVYFNHCAEYVTPVSGNYDFIFNYYYDTHLDVVVADIMGSAYVETNIFVEAYVTISGESWSKKHLIDKTRYESNDIKNWENTIDFTFWDIYLPAGTTVFLGARVFSLVYARALAFGGADGEFWCHKGRLNKIKVIDPNEPPSEPIINGPKEGKIGESYTYSFKSTDPNGDDVSYFISWGDASQTVWTPFQGSGTAFSEKHKWSAKGELTLKAKAKDKHGRESDWATFEVTVPRNKIVNRPLMRLFNNYPNLFLTLKYLLSF